MPRDNRMYRSLRFVQEIQSRARKEPCKKQSRLRWFASTKHADTVAVEQSWGENSYLKAEKHHRATGRNTNAAQGVGGVADRVGAAGTSMFITISVWIIYAIFHTYTDTLILDVNHQN
jgi:hypothetical protein